MRIIKATDFFDVFFIVVVFNNHLENDVDKIDEFIEVAEILASKLCKINYSSLVFVVCEHYSALFYNIQKTTGIVCISLPLPIISILFPCLEFLNSVLIAISIENLRFYKSTALTHIRYKTFWEFASFYFERVLSKRSALKQML